MKERVDYIEKLSESELAFLRNFESEFYGKGKSDGSAAAKEGFKRDNAARRSVERNNYRLSLDYFPVCTTLTPEDLVAAKEVLAKYPPQRGRKK